MKISNFFRSTAVTYPLAIIPLYITGFYMYLGHIDNFGSYAEFITTSFGRLLTLKMAIALGLLTILASSPFVFMQPEKRSPFGHFLHFLIVTGKAGAFRIELFEAIHYLAVAFGLSIVVIAKIMFLF